MWFIGNKKGKKKKTATSESDSDGTVHLAPVKERRGKFKGEDGEVNYGIIVAYVPAKPKEIERNGSKLLKYFSKNYFGNVLKKMKKKKKVGYFYKF